MYRKIQPYYYDSMLAHDDIVRGISRPSAEYYKKADHKMTIRLDTIRMVIELPDHFKLRMTDTYEDDITVSKEEGEAINKELLKMGGSALASEVSALTAAVRDLWNLLRARMR